MTRRFGIRRVPRVAGVPNGLVKAAPTSLPGGYTVPAGFSVSDATTLLGTLQARTARAVGGAVPLDRSQGFSALFGPGMPLIPAPLNEVNPSTYQADPRRYEFRTAYNLQAPDRPVPWTVLREAADKVDVIRLCLRTRKDEICQLELSFGFTPDAEQQLGITSTAAKREMRDKYSNILAALKDFWSKPDRTNDLSWSEWLGMALEERFVLDALSIYPRLTYGGDLASLEIIDGSTIKPLLDEFGNRPLPPAPAYQQWLYGFPRGEYTDDGVSDTWEGTAGSLIYKPYTRRTQSPFGFPEVEQALVSAEVYLRRQDWMRQEYTAGTNPTTFLKMDALAASITPEQRRAWETALNDEYSGDSAARHRLKLLPGGFEPVATKDMAERYKAEYDEFLVKILCAHMATQPSEIGFTPTNGLGGAGFSDAQEDVTYRKSLRPTLAWLVDIVNTISRQYLSMPPELTAQFLGMESEDEAAADKVAETRVAGGRMTLNEDRDRVGLPRYTFAEADMPMLMTQRGLVFIEGASLDASAGELIAPAQAPPVPATMERERPIAAEEAKAMEKSAYRRFLRKGNRRRPFEWRYHTPDEVADLIKAGEADPKAPNRPAWPGWERDRRTAGIWARRLSEAMTGAVQATTLAASWLALRKADDQNADATVWLHAHGIAVTGALTPVLRQVYTEGYLIGNRSADALLTGTTVDWSGWEPGDVDAAVELLGTDHGLAALLDQADVTISAIGAHRLDELARVLAAAVEEGQSVYTLAGNLRGVLDDPDWADMVATTELSRAMSSASLLRYADNGVEDVYWLTAEDERVCMDCGGNEDTGAIPLNQPWPNGAYQPPAHPLCRCAVTPAI